MPSEKIESFARRLLKGQGSLKKVEKISNESLAPNHLGRVLQCPKSLGSEATDNPTSKSLLPSLLLDSPTTERLPEATKPLSASWQPQA
jgi:hypothetical protein